MTRVSIIVAAYNVSEYLTRCVESLLAQTERSIQVIIVDDGATDDTPQIADSFASSDSRVLVVHQENQGLSGARNSGLLAATGEYVCFVDGDDWVEPLMVERMLSWIQSAKAEVAISGYIADYHDSDGMLLKRRKISPSYGIIESRTISSENIIDRNFVGLLGYAWNKLFDREWLLSLDERFEVGLRLIEDIEFNSRVLSSAERVVFAPEAFVHYMQRPSASLGKARDDSFLELRLRALHCVDDLLQAWGVDDEAKATIRARASVNDLWAALNSAASTSTPLPSIKAMLRKPNVSQLVELAQDAKSQGWKARWIAATMKKRRLRTALLPFIGYQTIKRFL